MMHSSILCMSNLPASCNCLRNSRTGVVFVPGGAAGPAASRCLFMMLHRNPALFCTDVGAASINSVRIVVASAGSNEAKVARSAASHWPSAMCPCSTAESSSFFTAGSSSAPAAATLEGSFLSKLMMPFINPHRLRMWVWSATMYDSIAFTAAEWGKVSRSRRMAPSNSVMSSLPAAWYSCSVSIMALEFSAEMATPSVADLPILWRLMMDIRNPGLLLMLLGSVIEKSASTRMATLGSNAASWHLIAAST
mmetsp:Transcript_106278/g.179461  ORF Transcript_106278/g.179461 Transcript_106278/m.179461 type:complete len:251 (-) Transcript_106278:695-1447(-)